ncbi:MAG: inner membrane protein YpjD [Aquirhabdus sp.]
MNSLTTATNVSAYAVALTQTQFIALMVILALYVGVFWHLLLYLWKKQAPRYHVSLSLLSIGAMLHAYILIPNLLTPAGVDFNLFNILSLTCWLMLTITLVFSTYRPVLALNIFAIPVATFGLVVGALWHAPYQPLSQMGHGLEWHIVLSLAAYCVLFMAATQAVLLHVQNRELKHRSLNRIWVSVLPPLQTMESLLFDMLLLGFVLLTVALLLGFMSVNNLMAQHLVHKTFFSILSWLLFGILLFGRWRMGWRGQRAIKFTLWGFGLLLIGFVGSKFVLELLMGVA